MMAFWAFVIGVVGYSIPVRGDPCSITDAIPQLSAVRSCFEAVPFNESWRSTTLDSLTTSLQQYSFTDLYTNMAAPYDYRINILQEVDALRQAVFTSDFAFQERLGKLIASLQDLHTIYTKPTCYSAVAFLPFAPVVESSAGNSYGKVVMKVAGISIGGSNVAETLAPLVHARQGWVIVAIDGQDPLAAVQRFADEEMPVSNDAGARFTFALSGLAYVARDLGVYAAPAANSTNITIQHPTSGVIEWLDVPWFAAPAVQLTSTASVTNRCLRTSPLPAVPDCSLVTSHTETTSRSDAKHALNQGRSSRSLLQDSLFEQQQQQTGHGSVAIGLTQWVLQVPSGNRDLSSSSSTSSTTTNLPSLHRRLHAVARAATALSEPAGLSLHRRHWQEASQRWASLKSLTAEQHTRLLAGQTIQDDPVPRKQSRLVPGIDTPEGIPPYWIDRLVERGVLSRKRLRAAVTKRMLFSGSDAVSLNGPNSLVRVQTSSVSPLVASSSDAHTAGTVTTMLEDFSAQDGVRVFSVKQPDKSPVIIVSIPTFNPSSISSCYTDVLNTACPTTAQLTAAQTCFGAGVDSFLAHAVTSPASYATQLGASRLVVNLLGNRGGNVLLGQLFMATAFRQLRALPSRVAGGVMRFRSSPIVSAMARFIEAAASASLGGTIESTFPAFSLLGYQVLQPGTGQEAVDTTSLTSSSSLADFSWYTEGEQGLAGSTSYTVSQPFKLLDVGALLSSSADLTPGISWNASNTALLSDLLCGSMCGQVLKTLQELGFAKVVGIGGKPFIRGDTTAFIGGFIRSSADSFTAELLALNRQGFTQYQAPSFLQTSASFGYNHGMLYSWARTDMPMQFSPIAADASIHTWANADHTEAAVSAAHSILVGSTDFVGTDLLAERDALLITVIVLAVMLALSMVLSLLCLAHNRSHGEVWEKTSCCEPCCKVCRGNPVCFCCFGRITGPRPGTDADPNNRHLEAGQPGVRIRTERLAVQERQPSRTSKSEEPDTDPVAAPSAPTSARGGPTDEMSAHREAIASRSAAAIAVAPGETSLVEQMTTASMR